MVTILVMGIGNMLLTDEGVGVLAAQELQKESWPEGIRIIDAGTFTHDIFYLFENCDAVLVMDIVHAHGSPGTIYRLTEEQLADNEKQRLSLHDIDLLDSLRMAEMLHGKKPLLRIVGMEPADYTTWNIGLSPILHEKFDDFLRIAREEIAALQQMLETANTQSMTEHQQA